MRKVQWNAVAASGEGDFDRPEPGPYVCVITDAADNEEREYVEVVYDIAEGPRRGYYSDAWGVEHPYAHHFFLSYKASAQGMLKGRLERIAESNPGFDPFAAWDAGRLDLFRGRFVGINLQEEEYRKADGSVGTRLNACEVRSVADVRDGKVKARPTKSLAADGARPTAATTAPAVDDIPLPWE